MPCLSPGPGARRSYGLFLVPLGGSVIVTEPSGLERGSHRTPPPPPPPALEAGRRPAPHSSCARLNSRCLQPGELGLGPCHGRNEKPAPCPGAATLRGRRPGGSHGRQAGAAQQFSGTEAADTETPAVKADHLPVGPAPEPGRNHGREPRRASGQERSAGHRKRLHTGSGTGRDQAERHPARP